MNDTGTTTLLAPFYDGARAEELLVPYCAGCDRFHWGPMTCCPYCADEGWVWRPVDGPARLYTWVRVHQAFEPSHRKAVPFVVGLVELEDAPGVRLVTSFPAADQPDVTVGMALTLIFEEPLGGGPILPVFVPQSLGRSV